MPKTLKLFGELSEDLKDGAVKLAATKFKDPFIKPEQIGFFESTKDGQRDIELVDLRGRGGATDLIKGLAVNALNSLPAMGLGAVTGAAGAAGVGAVTANPIAGAAGGLISAIPGALAGQYLTDKAVDWRAGKVGTPDESSVDRPVKDFAEELAIQRRLNPITSAVGNAIGGFGLATPAKGAMSVILRKASPELRNRVLTQMAASAGLNAVGEGATEVVRGEKIDPTRIIESALVGTLQTEPWGAGKLAHKVGSSIASRVAGRPLDVTPALSVELPEQPQLADKLTTLRELAGLKASGKSTPERVAEILKNSADFAETPVPADPSKLDALLGGFTKQFETMQLQDPRFRGELASEAFDAQAAGAEKSIPSYPFLQEILGAHKKSPLSRDEWIAIASGQPLEAVRAQGLATATARQAKVNEAVEAGKAARGATAGEDLQAGLAAELAKEQATDAKVENATRLQDAKETALDAAFQDTQEKLNAANLEERARAALQARVDRLTKQSKAARAAGEAETAVAKELNELRQELESIAPDSTKTPLDTGATAVEGEPVANPSFRRVGSAVVPTQEQQTGLPRVTKVVTRPVDASTVGAVPTGTAANPPVPESRAAVTAQVELTADPNAAKAVTLVPAGTPLPKKLPKGVAAAATEQGQALFNPKKITADEVKAAAAAPNFSGELQGIGPTAASGDVAVTAKTPEGTTVLSAVATPENIAAAAKMQRAVTGDRPTIVETMPAEQLLAERAAEAARETPIDHPSETEAQLRRMGLSVGDEPGMSYSGLSPEAAKRAARYIGRKLMVLPDMALYRWNTPAMRSAHDRIIDIEPKGVGLGRGQALVEADLARERAVNKYTNEDLSRYNTAFNGLNSESMARVDKYLSDMYDFGYSTVDLTQRERNAVEISRQAYQDMAQRYQSKGAALINGQRYINVQPNAVPWSVKAKTAKVLREGSTQNADKELRAEFNKAKNEFMSYRMGQGYSAEAALQMFNEYRKGISGGSVLDGQQYAATRKAEGLGIPPEWRDNAFVSFAKHAVRSAHDLAWWEHFESDPLLASWLGIKENGLGSETPPSPDGQTVGNNTAVRKWLESINQHRSYNPNGLMSALQVLGAGALGTTTAVTDFVTSPFIAMTMLEHPGQLPAIAKAMTKVTGNSALKAGASNMRNPALLERATGTLSEDAVRRIGDTTSRYQGRMLADTMSRQFSYEFGRALNEMKKGDSNYYEWLEKLGLEKGWESADDATRAEMVGAKFVDLIQSNYTSSTLPPWLLQGDSNSAAMAFLSLSRFAVARANTFRKHVWDPAKESGNLLPLVMAAAGIAGNEFVKDEFKRRLGMRLPNYWTLPELGAAKDKELMYTTLAHLNASSIIGLQATALFKAYQTAFAGEPMAQKMLVNLGQEANAELFQRLGQFFNAVDQGKPTAEAAADLAKATLADKIQFFRSVRSAWKAPNGRREEALYRRQTGQQMSDSGGTQLADEISPIGDFTGATDAAEAEAAYPGLVRALERGAPIPTIRNAVKPMEREVGEPIGFYDWQRRNGLDAGGRLLQDQQRQTFIDSTLKPMLDVAKGQAIVERERLRRQQMAVETISKASQQAAP